MAFDNGVKGYGGQGAGKGMLRVLAPVRRLARLDAPTLATLAVAALGLAWAVWTLAFALKWIPYPYQMDYGEGFITFVARLWAGGQWQWNIDQEPHITLMYGPLYPIILAPFLKAFGATLATVRAVTAVAACACLAFVYLIVRHLSGSRLAGLLAALLPLAHPVIRDWLIQARIDYLAIAFSLAGLYLAVRFLRSRWLFLSIIFFLLGFFTKQMTVTACAAVVVFLLLRDRRRGLLYAGLLAVGGVLLIAAGSLLTGGGLFRHMVLYNMTSSSLISTYGWWSNFKAALAPMAVSMVLALFYMLAEYRQRHELSIPALFWLIAGLESLLGLIRPGSYINYSLEFILATSLCAGLFIGRILQGESSLRALIPSLFQTWPERKLAGSLLLLLVLQTAVLGVGHITPLPPSTYAPAVARVQALIAGTSQPVVTENAWLVLSAGKTPYLEPFVFTNLKLVGVWDDSAYLEELRHERFDYLVLSRPLFDPSPDYSRFSYEVRLLMENHYHLIYSSLDEASDWYSLAVYRANRLE